MHTRALAAGLVLVCAASSPRAQTPDLYDLDTVRELRLYFKQANYWTLLRNNYSSKTNIEADLKVDGVTYPQVGVRFRGNTSYTRVIQSSQKIGFNIETNWMVPGQELYGYDHLNLNNGYHDPTFMREVITYQVARRYMAAPKANFVKVYLNDQYWGIYINVQQPNKDMMREWFRSDEGSRYRGFPNLRGGGRFDDSAYNYLGSVAANYSKGWEFKQGDGTDLMQMITVLTQTPAAQLPTALPKVFSVDGAMRYCVTMNALAHTDSYIGTGKDHSNYLDPTHGRFHMYPFDVNEALGAEGASATLHPFYNSTNSRRPVLSRTLAHAPWRRRYEAHFRTVLRECINWNYIGGLVTKYQNMIAADVAADTKKIYSTAAFTSNVTQNYTSGRRTIYGLKPLIDSREQYLKGFPELSATEASLSALSHKTPTTNQQGTVTVTASGASVVTLHYRVMGEFLSQAMFDDGQHGDGAANDGVYGGFVPGQTGGTRVDYYVSAETGAGALSFLPRTAEFQSPYYIVDHPTGTSPVVINEVLAKNGNVVKDNFGEFEDYIELRNTSNATVTVGGMYLSDKHDAPTRWQIPTGQTLQAGGTLLIWCDDEAVQGSMHASFKLDGDGESVYLFAQDGQTLVGQLSFGPQVEDVSIGRLFDQQAGMVSFLTPSPNAPNFLGTGGLRSFSALDSRQHSILLSLVGTTQAGSQASLELSQGPSSTMSLMLVSTASAYVPFIDGVVVLNSGQLQFLLPLDANGAASLKGGIPNTPAAPPLYLQAFAVDGGTLQASNALELSIY